jgi:hypothetical protein
MEPETQLAVRDDKGMFVKLTAEPDILVAYFKKVQELKRKILDETDYQSIQGKKFVKRSGWQKLAYAFGLSDKIVGEERKEFDKYFVYRILVEVTAPNGRISTGDGSCASNERNFAHLEHDCFATAHTRALSRAISNIVGLGEISAEEIDSNHMTPQQPQDVDLYCICTLPKPNVKGVCTFCNKITRKYVEEQKKRLQ